MAKIHLLDLNGGNGDSPLLTRVRALVLIGVVCYREVLGGDWKEEESRSQNFVQVRECPSPVPVPPWVLSIQRAVMARVTPASALCFLRQVQVLMPVCWYSITETENGICYLLG